MMGRVEAAYVQVSDSETSMALCLRDGSSTWAHKWYLIGPRLGSQHGFTDAQVTVTRRVALIDPRDDQGVTRLADLIKHRLPPHQHKGVGAALAEALMEYAWPRIPEPGPWGVVRAGCVHDSEPRIWVRHDDDQWHDQNSTAPDDWDSLRDPVLIRDGV